MTICNFSCTNMCTSGTVPIFLRDERSNRDTQAPPPSTAAIRRRGDQPGRRPDRSGDRPPDARPVRARVPRGRRRDERLRGEQALDPSRVPYRLGGPSHVAPGRLRMAMAAATRVKRPLARLAGPSPGDVQSASPRSIAPTSSTPAPSVRRTPSRSTFASTSVVRCRSGMKPSWTLIVSARPPAA